MRGMTPVTTATGRPRRAPASYRVALAALLGVEAAGLLYAAGAAVLFAVMSWAFSSFEGHVAGAALAFWALAGCTALGAALLAGAACVALASPGAFPPRLQDGVLRLCMAANGVLACVAGASAWSDSSLAWLSLAAGAALLAVGLAGALNSPIEP